MSKIASLLDSAVGLFSPQKGLQRTMARHAMMKMRAYEGASTADGWFPRRRGASANADHRGDAPMLRARARSLVQNNPYAAKALSCLVSNVVGEGITPSSRAAGSLAEKINALWLAWADVADADGGTDFHGLVAQAYRAMEQDGEVLIRLRLRRPEDALPVPLQLQILEIDHLDSGKSAALRGGGEIKSGIEFDALGRVVAYWLFDAHPGEGILSNLRSGFVSRRIDAAGVIHLFAPERPGQARGITRFAPVVTRLRDLAIYEDAELARKQMESLMSVFITGDGADFAVPGVGESQGVASERAAQIGELGRLAGGAILSTAGQNVTVAQPAVASGYQDSVRAHLYAVAAGFGVTYEMLTGDLSRVNFASSRVGLIEFRRAAEQRQWHVLVPRLLGPVWRAFVDAAFLAGKIPQADYAVEWTAPKWAYVNPLQDVQADAAEIAAGLSSVSEKLRQRGYQPDAVFAEIGTDFRKLKASGALEYLAFVKNTGGGSPLPVDDADGDEAEDDKKPAQKKAEKPEKAGAGKGEGRAALDLVADSLVRLAARAAPPAAAPEIRVELPPLPAPVVNVAAPEARVEIPTAPAPVVNVAAPEVRVEIPIVPAPVVNVAAPAVRVDNHVAPAVISEVKITGMPDRETTTTITRDKAGNIAQSVQTEKDKQ